MGSIRFAALLFAGWIAILLGTAIAAPALAQDGGEDGDSTAQIAVCEVGELTPDGESCWVPATFIPKTTTETIDATSETGEPTVTCPEGFEANGVGVDTTCERAATTVETAAVIVEDETTLMCPDGWVETTSGGEVIAHATSRSSMKRPPISPPRSSSNVLMMQCCSVPDPA